MKFYHVPVFLIGLFLALIGLEVILAPAVIVVTPAHMIAFDTFGRVPLGIFLTLTGLATLYEGWKGSKHMVGLFGGIVNAFFWFIVTLLPLKYGTAPTSIFGLDVAGPVNSIATFSWMLIISLGIYYYSKRYYYWNSLKDKNLLEEIRSGR